MPDMGSDDGHSNTIVQIVCHMSAYLCRFLSSATLRS